MTYDRCIKLVIESKIDHIDLLSKASRAICHTVASDEVLLYNIELSLVEALTNVINHSYHRKPGHFIEVLITLNETYVSFQIIDTGDKAPPLNLKKELTYDPGDVSTLPESGMGLFLIHCIMDEVFQSEDGGKNILIMKKNFDQKE